MPIKESLKFARKCEAMDGKRDAYITPPRNGIYQFRRRVPDLVRILLPDAPIHDEKSLGTSSLREAERRRDQRKKLFDQAFLKIVVADEEGKPCPFDSWHEIEGEGALSLLDLDLDEVAIPPSINPYVGSKSFNDTGQGVRVPSQSLRDVLVSNLADQIEDLLPNLRAELEEIDGKEAFYKWAASGRGKKVLAGNPKAGNVVAKLKQVTGKLSWLDGAEKRIREKVPAYSSSGAGMLRSHASRLERMEISPPDLVQRSEVRKLIQRLADEGLARDSVSKVVLAGKLIAKTCFPDDIERARVWEGHELKGYQTEEASDFEVHHIEQLFSVQPPSKAVVSVFRVGLYTGARPSEIIQGIYHPDQQLFEVGKADLNQRAGRSRKTKESHRRIPVHPEIKADVEHLRDFPTSYKQCQRHFKTWKEAAGIDDPTLTLNSTRHSFVTHMDRLGVEEGKVMVLNGRKMPGSHAVYKHRKAHEFTNEIARLDWHEQVHNWSELKTD